MTHRTADTANTALRAGLPAHWTPAQALAVFECLHALREALWGLYGADAQLAWREHLRSGLDDGRPQPEFDPDAPF